MMDRRGFLKTTALAGLFPRVTLGETRLDPASVAWGSGIEPLVKVLEDTPREKLLEEIALRVKKGISYTEVLAALFLANVRNRPMRLIRSSFPISTVATSSATIPPTKSTMASAESWRCPCANIPTTRSLAGNGITRRAQINENVFTAYWLANSPPAQTSLYRR